LASTQYLLLPVRFSSANVSFSNPVQFTDRRRSSFPLHSPITLNGIALYLPHAN
jgi:hypothetical protein